VNLEAAWICFLGYLQVFNLFGPELDPYGSINWNCY
jgi:hypothetical protein